MKDAESIKYGLVCCSSDYGVSDICGRMGCPYKTGHADCVHKLAGDALELIKKLEAKDAWNPVELGLPEEPGEYLVAYHPCHWDDVRASVKVGLDNFRGKTSWARKKYQRVIAWKKKPEPPKGEDDAD